MYIARRSRYTPTATIRCIILNNFFGFKHFSYNVGVNFRLKNSMVNKNENETPGDGGNFEESIITFFGRLVFFFFIIFFTPPFIGKWVSQLGKEGSEILDPILKVSDSIRRFSQYYQDFFFSFFFS